MKTWLITGTSTGFGRIMTEKLIARRPRRGHGAGWSGARGDPERPPVDGRAGPHRPLGDPRGGRSRVRRPRHDRRGCLERGLWPHGRRRRSERRADAARDPDQPARLDAARAQRAAAPARAGARPAAASAICSSSAQHWTSLCLALWRSPRSGVHARRTTSPGSATGRRRSTTSSASAAGAASVGGASAATTLAVGPRGSTP